MTQDTANLKKLNKDLSEDLKKMLELFDKLVSRRIKQIKNGSVIHSLAIFKDIVDSTIPLIVSEKIFYRKNSKRIKEFEKYIYDGQTAYNNWTINEFKKFKDTPDTKPAIQKWNKENRDALSRGQDIVDWMVDFAVQGGTLGGNKKYANLDIDTLAKKQRKEEKNTGKKIKTGLVAGLSVATGSALPILIDSGHKAQKEWRKKFKETSGMGKLKMGAAGITSGLGILAGSPGAIMAGSMLNQSADREVERNQELNKSGGILKKKVSNFGSDKISHTFGKGVGYGSTRKSTTPKASKNITLGSSFGGGMTMDDSPSSPSSFGGGDGLSIKLLTEISNKLDPLQSLAKSNEKISYISEETLEDARDAKARAGLQHAQKAGGSFGVGSSTSFGKYSDESEGSKPEKESGGLLSTIMDFLPFKNRKGSKGGKISKLMSKMNIFKGGKGGGLLSKVMGKGGGLLGKGAGLLGKAAPLLGGIAKFAGPIGLALTAGQALHGGFKGWNDAENIAGVKEGQKATTLQKMGAGLSGGLSSLTMGLIDPKTMYKGVSTLAKYSPIGLISSFFGGDKEKPTPESGTSSTPTKSTALALAAVEAAGIDGKSAEAMKKKFNENNVANIKDNTNGLSYMSEATALNKMETITDIKNNAKQGNQTRDAINNISIQGGNEKVTRPSIIITTGDMDSFATRLAKSY